MQAWEYQTIQSWNQATDFRWSSGNTDTFLNDMGLKGWELVSVVTKERNAVEWIFKRPKGGFESAVTTGGHASAYYR